MITAGTSFSAGAATGLMAAVALRGPGNLRDDDVPMALIFDAGKNSGAADALTRFYAEDVPALDWLRDYVMDDDLMSLSDDADDEFGAHEEPEEIYNKADLTQIQSDGDWADG